MRAMYEHRFTNAKIPWICAGQSVDEAGNTDGRLAGRTTGRRFARPVAGSHAAAIATRLQTVLDDWDFLRRNSKMFIKR